MRRCPNCGANHGDAVITCDCGQVLEPSNRSERKAQVGTGKKYSQVEWQPNYSALRTISSIYGFLGWLTLLIAISVGLYGGYQALWHQAPASGSLIMAGIALGGCLLAPPLFAVRDVIAWMMEMSSRGRSIERLVGKIAASGDGKGLSGV